MTTEQKHRISREIVSSITKIDYYKTAINRIKKHPTTVYGAEYTIRFAGMRNTVYGELGMSDCLRILKLNLYKEQGTLKSLEKKIK